RLVISCPSTVATTWPLGLPPNRCLTLSQPLRVRHVPAARAIRRILDFKSTSVEPGPGEREPCYASSPPPGLFPERDTSPVSTRQSLCAERDLNDPPHVSPRQVRREALRNSCHP